MKVMIKKYEMKYFENKYFGGSMTFRLQTIMKKMNNAVGTK